MPGKGGNRYFKSIGLGFKTPREASEGRFLYTYTFLVIYSNIVLLLGERNTFGFFLINFLSLTIGYDLLLCLCNLIIVFSQTASLFEI